jgi:hypothetical protein
MWELRRLRALWNVRPCYKDSLTFFTKPWIRMGEWMYRFIYSWLGTSWRWMASFTSQHLYPRGKEPTNQLDRRLDVPRNRSGLRGQDSNSDPWAVQPVASRYTDCTASFLSILYNYTQPACSSVYLSSQRMRTSGTTLKHCSIWPAWHLSGLWFLYVGLLRGMLCNVRRGRKEVDRNDCKKDKRLGLERNARKRRKKLKVIKVWRVGERRWDTKIKRKRSLPKDPTSLPVDGILLDSFAVSCNTSRPLCYISLDTIWHVRKDYILLQRVWRIC